MIPIRPQTIRAPSGEELIVLTRADFDALVAAVADQFEDADDAAIFRRAEGRASRRSGCTIARRGHRSDAVGRQPAPRVASLERSSAGRHGRTHEARPGYISDLETGRKAGTAETLDAIAASHRVQL